MGSVIFASLLLVLVFFFNDTATTEIYTLSLHDALPISTSGRPRGPQDRCRATPRPSSRRDRKSTRLNFSHPSISYAVFCLKKKKTNLNLPYPSINTLRQYEKLSQATQS